MADLRFLATSPPRRTSIIANPNSAAVPGAYEVMHLFETTTRSLILL